MPELHQSSLLNGSEWVSESLSESVTDKHSQWSDSGPIKIEGFHLKAHDNDFGKHPDPVVLKQETKEVDIEEEQDKKKMEGEVREKQEEMMPGSIMKREKIVSESTSREVGIVRTGWFS